MYYSVIDLLDIKDDTDLTAEFHHHLAATDEAHSLEQYAIAMATCSRVIVLRQIRFYR